MTTTLRLEDILLFLESRGHDLSPCSPCLKFSATQGPQQGPLFGGGALAVAWNTVEGTAAVGPSHFGIDSIGRLGFVVTVVAMPMAMAAASGVGRGIWMEPRWMGKTPFFPVDVLPFLPNHPGIIDMIWYDTIRYDMIWYICKLWCADRYKLYM